MIKRQGYIGVVADKAGEIFLKIGDEKYSVSNSWNHLFICETDSLRTELVTSVMEQLKNRNISSKLISVKPDVYNHSLKADPFSAPIVRAIIKKMEKRYDAICDSESRNYIDHNSKGNEANIPLYVLVVDGVDQVAGSVKYQRFIENLNVDDPIKRIQDAIKSSATHDIYVDYPIVISSTENTEFKVFYEKDLAVDQQSKTSK